MEINIGNGTKKKCCAQPISRKGLEFIRPIKLFGVFGPEAQMT